MPAAPSFHDGGAAADVAVCARPVTGSSGADKAGSAAKVESRKRRLILEEARVGFMSVSSIGKAGVEAGNPAGAQ
jgi:hypothetical protein